MRKSSLITAILLLFSAWIVAQSGSMQQPAGHDQSNQPTSQQPGATQETQPTATDHGSKSIEGCVSSVAGGFAITDNSGKTYQLAGDTSQVQAGQYDRVTGTEDTSGGAAAAGGAPSTFTVRKVKVVSTTCPTK